MGSWIAVARERLKFYSPGRSAVEPPNHPFVVLVGACWFEKKAAPGVRLVETAESPGAKWGEEGEGLGGQL